MNTPNLIHNLDDSPEPMNRQDGFSLIQFFMFVFLAVVAGVGFGFAGSKLSQKNTRVSQTVQKENTVGIVDKKTFKDSAEGLLREGGIDGEGNFHLERTGGDSQNVYLTSTTVDLSKYIGKKVKVWGATFQAQKAGWLMDVGLVELL